MGSALKTKRAKELKKKRGKERETEKEIEREKDRETDRKGARECELLSRHMSKFALCALFPTSYANAAASQL